MRKLEGAMGAQVGESEVEGEMRKLEGKVGANVGEMKVTVR